MASGIINNKYRITKRIGGGSFGEIFLGQGPNGEKVAVKFERHGTRCPQLRHEYKVYRELTGCFGFAQVHYFGVQDNYNVMVMDLLGLSLEDLFNKCQRRFSLKTVLQIADQMLERVDALHSRHLIHRDIKPANFVIGLGQAGATIYCVDFGLSKRYRHPKTLQHIPHRDGRSLTGTPRYASVNNHLGVEQSRRDDLESIGYVLIYFLKGTLPWQGLKAKNAQKKYRLILEKKQQVSIAQLCQGCPSQFAEFLAYTRSLKFDSKPDIPYLRKLFRDLYHSQNCAAQQKLWDWDGMDIEFNSMSGSVNGNDKPPAILPPTQNNNMGIITASQPLNNHSLRPTTAAAIVSGGNGILDNDLMIGSGDKDDLDNDYPHTRSSTALGSGRMDPNRPSTAGYSQQGGPNNSNWGYSRNEMKPGSNGVAINSNDHFVSNTDHSMQQIQGSRRPHTAHGGRAIGSLPSPHGSGSGNGYYTEMDSNGQSTNDSNGGTPPIAAGARDMMRYRRSRGSADASTMALPQQQAQQQLGYTPNVNYINSGQQIPNTQAISIRKPNNGLMSVGMNNPMAGGGVANGGWGSNYQTDRPKSANGLMTNNLLSNHQNSPANQWANVQQSAGNSAYSYNNSMKNRFMQPGASTGVPKMNGGSQQMGMGMNGSNSGMLGSGNPSMVSMQSNNGKPRLLSLQGHR